jgi:hypothetical protein
VSAGLVGAITFFIALFVAGLIVRTWTVVVLAILVWPTWFAGLRLGLWGSGVGDNWQLLVLVLTAGSFAGALTGVAAGRLLLRR